MESKKNLKINDQKKFLLKLLVAKWMSMILIVFIDLTKKLGLWKNK